MLFFWSMGVILGGFFNGLRSFYTQFFLLMKDEPLASRVQISKSYPHKKN